MKRFLGYISVDKMSSLFSYELKLKDQGCRPLVFGQDDKKFYVIYKADKKPKGLGRNKEITETDIYVLPNRTSPEM